jgi:fumarate reductase flavoprotein subunit
VTGAVERIHELENELGCFFDRNPDGTLHQKAFAGQSFDRTVHKGDLTGIEIINRLAEQVWARGIERLEEYRAVALIPARASTRVAGVLFIDIRTGEFVLVRARAVVLATGGGPTMYRYHTPSADKTCDGLAMALRTGLALRDIEMVQFHPTGLLAGAHTRMTGTVLEEGLRGAGGHLVNAAGERFMLAVDPRGERATRDIVSRGIYAEMCTGRTTPNGGVWLAMSHLGADRVRREFRGMVERCADCGFDLAGGRVEVVPTAHYMMGGVEFDLRCRTARDGLFAAGEDTGGVHGANRLGGNGVANSTVFGGIAGDEVAAWAAAAGEAPPPDAAAVAAEIVRCEAPLSRTGGDLPALRDSLLALMWDDVGIVRSRRSLLRAIDALARMQDELDRTGVAGGTREFNLGWHDWLDLDSLLTVSRAIAHAALAREDSRGAHYREDFPETGDLERSAYTRTWFANGGFSVEFAPVAFTRVRPGQSLG